MQMCVSVFLAGLRRGFLQRMLSKQATTVLGGKKDGPIRAKDMNELMARSLSLSLSKDQEAKKEKDTG